LATDVLKSTSARSFSNTGTIFRRNNHHLRESSPAPSDTGSTGSRSSFVPAKRKADDSRSYANVAKKGTGQSQSGVSKDFVFYDSLEKAGVSIARAASVIERAESKIELLAENNPFTRVVEDLREALWANNDALRDIVNALRSDPRPDSGNTGYNGKTDKMRTSRPQSTMVTLPFTGTGRNTNARKTTGDTDYETCESDTDMEEDTVLENTPQVEFRKAVRSAERSTLVFNLDMGKVPIMNRRLYRKRLLWP